MAINAKTIWRQRVLDSLGKHSFSSAELRFDLRGAEKMAQHTPNSAFTRFRNQSLHCCYHDRCTCLRWLKCGKLQNETMLEKVMRCRQFIISNCCIFHPRVLSAFQIFNPIFYIFSQPMQLKASFCKTAMASSWENENRQQIDVINDKEIIMNCRHGCA